MVNPKPLHNCTFALLLQAQIKLKNKQNKSTPKYWKFVKKYIYVFVLLKQFAEEFTKDFEAVCQEEGEEMPKDFDARAMFDAFMNVRVIPEMINAIAVLREHGEYW